MLDILQLRLGSINYCRVWVGYTTVTVGLDVPPLRLGCINYCRVWVKVLLDILTLRLGWIYHRL